MDRRAGIATRCECLGVDDLDVTRDVASLNPSLQAGMAPPSEGGTDVPCVLATVSMEEHMPCADDLLRARRPALPGSGWDGCAILWRDHRHEKSWPVSNNPPCSAGARLL